ncbi:hypothetical protein P7L54_16380 [Acinetobacter bereziniae]|uniref:Uncharacterized protein n=1 Tax=Acinetobacter bereziniae LMG 1003 = CIP 70.12 TaxID=981324 RepID=N9D2B6_ACIBZ|nr:hypothetical protein [Acinetobacter bereziniae]ENV91981.1 hypothetical protein F938_03113 [Acinetobacter bereziniae LMG 1003 = CIP 70.12]MBJ9908756.1 hypothetical protein [Acinetobacter bereziniae]MBJ9930670.1 hypothetical protein [Acinetobacter bereziniae]MDG3557522.1 hypothetical protein [Acinetobacter bereziniae]MDP6002744.1 hypothetical protein [Acinetobacter bereziniae]
MGLFIMKKYITLFAGILVCSHIYADSYVFGGRAHFRGVLVHESCAISVEKNRLTTKTPHIPVQIHFSFCPMSIYDNLAIGLSEPNKHTQEIFFTTPQAKNDFDKEINIQGYEYISIGQRLIQYITLPKDDQNIKEKSINLFINHNFENTLAQSQHILISVFYP